MLCKSPRNVFSQACACPFLLLATHQTKQKHLQKAFVEPFFSGLAGFSRVLDERFLTFLFLSNSTS